MEKTRKAFVVLAAAVTAGNAGGCGSNSKSTEDAKNVDTAAAVDTKVPEDAASTPDTNRGDVSADMGRDTSGADVSGPEATADTSQRDAGGADEGWPDAVADVTVGDVMLVDGAVADASNLDGVADTLEAGVFLRMDASVPPPDNRLVMPAGTAYDVLAREQLS
jgi:hypothetical protein